MISEKRTVIVKDVDLFYTKVDQPVKPFGTVRWELQMRTNDKSTADMWKKEYFLNIKEIDGSYAVNVHKNAVNKEGADVDPPQVVDKARSPIKGNNIGNGSKGNVKLFQYPYDVAGKKGVSSMLVGLQVVDLVPYEPDSSIDFEILDEPAKTGTDF